ncbi:MAG: serine hydrolase domain-containing protein [Acidobacteriota bacterium]
MLAAPDLASDLDAIVSSGRTSMQTAGLSVAVRLGDRVIFAEGYGEADLEHHIAATPETVYRIASVTKQFTAVAILQLADAERLALQDPVSAHVPIFDQGPAPITLHQLLTHTSGLRNYSRFIGDRNRLPLTREDVVAMFEDEDLDFRPGRDWAYSNSGYFLLGLAIEHVSGLTYGEYVEKALAKPAGLHDTLYCDNARLIEHRARGYVSRKGRFQNAKAIEMHAPFAAGALCSTVLDLVQWARALFGGSIVSPIRLREMTTPVEIRGRAREYGYGVVIDDLDGHRRFQHGGSISGFSAYLCHYPDSNLSIAVLANTGGVDAEGLADELARAVFASGQLSP